MRKNLRYDTVVTVIKRDPRDLDSLNSVIEANTRRGLIERTGAAFQGVQQVVDLTQDLIKVLEKFKVSDHQVQSYLLPKLHTGC